VVVDKSNALWSRVCLVEADADLIVDRNAVLAIAVSPKGFQLVALRDGQIVQLASGNMDGDLAEGNASELSKTLDRPPLKSAWMSRH
jgi:hypothetical protein